MQEKEPKQSLLTWESAVVVLALVGAGFVLGSREMRERMGKEIRLYYQGLGNVIRRRGELKQSEKERSEFQGLLRQVFPQGLRMEK